MRILKWVSLVMVAMVAVMLMQYPTSVRASGFCDATHICGRVYNGSSHWLQISGNMYEGGPALAFALPPNTWSTEYLKDTDNIGSIEAGVDLTLNFVTVPAFTYLKIGDLATYYCKDAPWEHEVICHV